MLSFGLSFQFARGWCFRRCGRSRCHTPNERQRMWREGGAVVKARKLKLYKRALGASESANAQPESA
jgi:hypothetical protein